MPYTCHFSRAAIASIAVSFILTSARTHAGVDTWTGAGADSNWMTAANWNPSDVPLPGDSLVFDTTATNNYNNFPANTPFSGITFAAPAGTFNLTGNSVLLSGQTNGNTLGVLNQSASTETVTLHLGLDWGIHTFDSPAGSLVLGGVAPNAGAAAYFDNNVYTNNGVSGSLSNDASGLLGGLGGLGLIFNDTASTNGYSFSGLATVGGGGEIVPYSTFPSVLASPTGPIGALSAATGQNVEITDTNNDTYSLAGGSATYFNSLFLSEASTNAVVLGSSSGAIVMGSVSGIGGIYLPAASNAAQVATIGGGAGTVLLAGTATNSAGTLVFGVNGSGGNAQAVVNAKIANNGSGAVTVAKVGTGTVSLNVANSYTGSTYVAQGQIIGSNTTSFGTGPVYIAGGATATTELSGSPTVANSFYLSPGLGAPSVPSYGALVNAGGGNSSTYTYSGTINLLGAPVSAPPGDRIAETGAGASGYSTGLGVAFTGVTTGTGTLDLYAAQSMFFILKYSGSNSYQGGIIIESASNAYNLTRTGVNGEIPSGPGTGNMTLIAGPGGVARFDVNGHLQTVNGLIAPNTTNAINQLVGNYQGNGNSSSGTLTLGANGNNNGGPFTFYGVLSDASAQHSVVTFNLVKIGAGTQILAGSVPNPYVGTTTVSGGTLALAQYAAIPDSSIISVSAGATLDVSALAGPFDLVAATSLGHPQVLDCTGQIYDGTNSTIIDGTIDPFVTTVGTLSNTGALTLDGGSTYIWNMNNATGTAGGDPGWSLVKVQGGLTINANSGQPMNINITSLKADAPGVATNFNPAGAASWPIIQTTAGITNFSPSAFNLVTTAFSNNVAGGTFGIELSGDQKSILLTFTPAASICVPPANVNIVGGNTAAFTVDVCADAQPATYQWYWNNNPVSNGQSSGSGSTINIASTGSSSTLSIPNAEDADDGTYSVTVTGAIGGSPSASATLTIIDPPGNLNVAESDPTGVTLSAGGVDRLAVIVGNGTPPFSYIWSFEGVPLSNQGGISGADTPTLSFDAGVAVAGTYTVIVSNAAGMATSQQTVIPYVTSVPNQYIYESFDSYTPQAWNDSSGIPPTDPSWEDVTNLYNEATGEPSYWYNGASSGPTDSAMAVRSTVTGANSRNGGEYPWPGLASDSAYAPDGSVNELFWSGGEFGGNTADNHLHFTSDTFPPGSKVYFSFVLNVDNPRGFATTQAGADLIFGLGGTGTDFTYKLAAGVTSDELSTNNQQFSLGLFKGDGDNISLTEPYGEWATNYTEIGEYLFIVGRYTVMSGGTNATDDTVALWINPATNTFYASEADVPPPTLGPSGFGAPNGPINEAIVRNTGLIGGNTMLDLRIGSSWASVTPPYGPTLSLANQTVASGQTAMFASQNAGDPVNTYSWQFNGGATLTDNSPNADGSYYVGSSTATLMIVNAQAAELGTYTVTGQNSDAYGNSFTGSASATLSFAQPPLAISASGANALIVWPTNFANFTLQETSSLNRPVTWTAVSAGAISTVGTNNVATVHATTGDQFFRLQSQAP